MHGNVVDIQNMACLYKHTCANIFNTAVASEAPCASPEAFPEAAVQSCYLVSSSVKVPCAAEHKEDSMLSPKDAFVSVSMQPQPVAVAILST